MKNNKTITIIILSILLVGTFVYLGYKEHKQTKELELMQYGFNTAIIQIAQIASKCEQVPLTIGNQTINLIAVECLGGQNG